MFFWPFYGIKRKMTERFDFKNDENIISKNHIFGHSLHIYTIDVGNNNTLNFEMEALKAPQYNVHRFGIFFSESPRHADMLMILGKPTKKMVNPLLETIKQMPSPFNLFIIEGNQLDGIDFDSLNLPNIIIHIKGFIEADEMLMKLIDLMGVKKE